MKRRGTGVAAPCPERWDLFCLLVLVCRDFQVWTSLGCTLRSRAQGRQILPAQRDQRCLVAKVRDDPLILHQRFVRLALFAITFAETEQCGGGDLSLIVV